MKDSYNERRTAGASCAREEIRLKASELVQKIKDLVAEGNVRRIVVMKENGDRLLEIPMTGGVLAAGALTIIAPVLAGIGAMAALLARVRIRVIRDEE